MTTNSGDLVKRLRDDALQRENGLQGRSDGPAIEYYSADHIEALEAEVGRLRNALVEYEIKQFRFHWLGGDTTDGPGMNAADAMTRLGYGQGAMAALDYWETLPDKAAP